MGHARGKLTPVGRLLHTQRITELGWSVSQAAASLGVSRETAHRRLRRWHQEGHRGLDNRSGRPHRSPRRLAASVERRILRLRRRLRWAPHRLAPLVGYPRSTILQYSGAMGSRVFGIRIARQASPSGMSGAIPGNCCISI